MFTRLQDGQGSSSIKLDPNTRALARGLVKDNFAYTAREICFSLRELSLSYNISVGNIIKQSKFMLLSVTSFNSIEVIIGNKRSLDSVALRTTRPPLPLLYVTQERSRSVLGRRNHACLGEGREIIIEVTVGSKIRPKYSKSAVSQHFFRPLPAIRNVLEQ